MLADAVGPAQPQSDEIVGGNIPTAEPSTLGEIPPPPSGIESPIRLTDALGSVGDPTAPAQTNITGQDDQQASTTDNFDTD